MRLPAVLTAILLGLTTLSTVPVAAPAQAAAPTAAAVKKVATRSVSFDLKNTNEGLLDCGTKRTHTVRGTLVGPADVVYARTPATTINLLLHDARTGGWFWHLRAKRGQDYAGGLARQGQTSLVIDRLGYGRSRLANGNNTCLAAQAAMVHQIVQRLYSGRYDAAGPRPEPAAGHVVVHGHGTGATIAQLEAARYSDVGGLVLLSPVTTSPTRAAVTALTDQLGACTSASYAPISAAAYRKLMFRSAPAAVRRAATNKRSATPCGDVTSVAGAVLQATTTARKVDAPVLVLRGGKDAAGSGNAGISSKKKVVRRTIAGAGNALVLEKQAPKVRRQVLAFVNGLDAKVR